MRTGGFGPGIARLKRWIDGGRARARCCPARMATDHRPGMLPDATGHRPALVRQPFMPHEPRLMIAEVLIHHLDVDALPVRAAAGGRRRAPRGRLPTWRGETLATDFLETASGAPVEVDGHDGRAGLSAAPAGSAGDRRQQRRASCSTATSCACSARPRAASASMPDCGYQASFDARHRPFRRLPAKPARRSRPTPPTTSRRCAWSSTPTGPPAAARVAVVRRARHGR